MKPTARVEAIERSEDGLRLVFAVGAPRLRRACYAGEIMSFSSVEHVSEYSRALVDRFF